MEQTPVWRRPCSQCPWLRASEPGQIPEGVRISQLYLSLRSKQFQPCLYADGDLPEGMVCRGRRIYEFNKQPKRGLPAKVRDQVDRQLVFSGSSSTTAWQHSNEFIRHHFACDGLAEAKRYAVDRFRKPRKYKRVYFATYGMAMRFVFEQLSVPTTRSMAPMRLELRVDFALAQGLSNRAKWFYLGTYDRKDLNELRVHSGQEKNIP